MMRGGEGANAASERTAFNSVQVVTKFFRHTVPWYVTTTGVELEFLTAFPSTPKPDMYREKARGTCLWNQLFLVAQPQDIELHIFD